MMPNAWFYKLKDMGTRRRNHKKQPSSSSSSASHTQPHPRKSHHFTRQLQLADEPPAEPPRKSSRSAKPKRRPAAATARNTSSSGCSCGGRAALDSVAERTSDQYPSPSDDVDDAAANAIATNITKTSPQRRSNGSDGDQLPPIITRSSSTDAADGSTCPAITKKDKCLARDREPRSSPSRRFTVNSPGPKFRMIMNSPRVSSKRFGQPAAVSRRKSVSKRSLTDGSLAIVKSTSDPQRDFRESMVEMIVENKISASNELEDLLACYLSLNTDEYHDIIIKVFKQIWFDMSDFGVH